MALIAVINKSTMVKDADIETMCAAIQIQLDLHFCAAWGLKNSTIRFYADPSKVPGYAWLFSMIDNDKSVPDALGYHTLQNGHVEAFIMAEPILTPSAGGVVLFDSSNAENYSISGCLSHEVMEALADRFCSSWASTSDGKLWALEVADPVEGNNVVVNVNGQSVFVSDFVFPSFFCSEATAMNAPFNFCKTVNVPFQLAKNGYAVVGTTMSNVSQIYGETMPKWRRELKQSNRFGRGARRVGKKGIWARFVEWITV